MQLRLMPVPPCRCLHYYPVSRRDSEQKDGRPPMSTISVGSAIFFLTASVGILGDQVGRKVSRQCTSSALQR